MSSMEIIEPPAGGVIPPRVELLPHEKLIEEGYEYVKSETYASRELAEAELAAFKKTGWANVYNKKEFEIVPYEDGFMIYGIKIVHSPFAGRRKPPVRRKSA